MQNYHFYPSLSAALVCRSLNFICPGGNRIAPLYTTLEVGSMGLCILLQMIELTGILQMSGRKVYGYACLSPFSKRGRGEQYV